MTSHITQALTNLLGKNSGAPFLFIGSGFSRRYIGLEQWDELLRKFCTSIKEFGYYSSQHNQDLPSAASEMSKDFNEAWWKEDCFRTSREKFSQGINGVSSALKHEIAHYLKNLSHNQPKDQKLSQELKALSNINVDGIITTNWDLFLEELFPDYKVFIGQEELLFSNPQSIAEIYKIHGCSSQPNSLILTKEDYESFDKKNPYLAAKLITIFIEHPIIFIGYSISDKNIQNIISSIVNCLGQDKLDAFGKNLIFIQRSTDNTPSIQPSLMAIGDSRLNITVIKTNDFIDIYEAIETTKRKIPARILRYCKEQMYDLVKSSEPEKRLALVDIDEIENKEDVEFVVGVGVASKQQELAKTGYKGVSINDIFLDIIRKDSKFKPDDLLRESYPSFEKLPNKYIPGFRYLRSCNINSSDELNQSEFSPIGKLLFRHSIESYRTSQYKKYFSSYFHEKNTREIIESTSAEKAAILIPFQKTDQIDIETVKLFILENENKISASSYATYFRKLICFIDLIEYGFN
ncbi:SIR2 family protein [Chromobacterium haemolyticum]|uniref:SIR2 family protein n=1 Tax=Chromobacterium haemolyticum TaxID=394935 RepID=UPI0002E9D036|nr:SIR2 family protein [Chromobacterium haemolyticum]PTU68334.1 hypothetical protein DBB33_02210 [Chromobacterium haemolyticum]